jgi:hypothetical protein
MPKVTVQLVSWNGAKYIPYLLSSLANLSCSRNFLVRVSKQYGQEP